jgi:hypothetical protein
MELLSELLLFDENSLLNVFVFTFIFLTVDDIIFLISSLSLFEFNILLLSFISITTLLKSIFSSIFSCSSILF